MTNLQLQAARLLFADWFAHFLGNAGILLNQRGRVDGGLRLGGVEDRQVIARFSERPPFLEFIPTGDIAPALVAEAEKLAVAQMAGNQFGGTTWYYSELREPKFNFFNPHGPMKSLVFRLGTQQRILGWRRLGPSILLEFTEIDSEAGQTADSLVAPQAVVKAHIAVPGPRAGFFSDFVAHSWAEPLAAICSFALGRPVPVPLDAAVSPDWLYPAAAERQRDAGVLTLARKSVSLDIVSPRTVAGGFEWSERARSALLTFDAAMRQERDSVANLLYVVAAESLTVPSAKWRDQRLTARFVDFYLRELESSLDAIIAHGAFEASFEIKRAGRPDLLRKRLLQRIYGLRSLQVHEGLVPAFKGTFGVYYDNLDFQRALIHDFAEAAILSYLNAPRSSLIGHPLLHPAAPADPLNPTRVHGTLELT
jgi:hypothetical protein